MQIAADWLNHRSAKNTAIKADHVRIGLLVADFQMNVGIMAIATLSFDINQIAL